MEYNEVLDKLVDKILVLDLTKFKIKTVEMGCSYLVPVCRNGDEGWSEADGNVVRVHHVLITERKIEF